MVGLPRDIIESAKVDGATDFQVFMKIVLPLSFPALASFAIFQFLWTWNDLLVAKVFLPSADDTKVMTVKIADDLLGSRGGDWGILATAAFVSNRGAAAGFLHNAKIPRARSAGRLGEIGKDVDMNAMAEMPKYRQLAGDTDWWRGGVIYQI